MCVNACVWQGEVSTGPLAALDKVGVFRGDSVPEDRLFLALDRVLGTTRCLTLEAAACPQQIAPRTPPPASSQLLLTLLSLPKAVGEPGPGSTGQGAAWTGIWMPDPGFPRPRREGRLGPDSPLIVGPSPSSSRWEIHWECLVRIRNSTGWRSECSAEDPTCQSWAPQRSLGLHFSTCHVGNIVPCPGSCYDC